MIISIKPAQLQPQYLPIQKCECYKLYGLDSPMEVECRGKFIKTHYKQKYCLFHLQYTGEIENYRLIRPKKNV